MSVGVRVGELKSTPDTAADFVANEPLERRQAARSELAQLLANCHTED